MPGVITSGRLYRIIPPLYRLDAKKLKGYGHSKDYIFGKKEYYSLYHNIIASNMDVAILHPKTMTQAVKGGGDMIPLKKRELIQMLDSTIRYQDELNTLQNRSFCNRDVLEYVCYFMSITKNSPAGTFQKILKQKFPELSYSAEYKSTMGSYNGENVSLIVDDIFMRMASRMIQMIDNMDTFHVLVKNKKSSEDPMDDWSLMTYGQFMDMCSKTFMIDIEQRYKGIGEGKADMTFPSMMNPKTRKLVRITMDDVEDAMKTIQLLHGATDEMRRARRKMLAEADITLQDIDN